jgi:hypothetical protein
MQLWDCSSISPFYTGTSPYIDNAGDSTNNSTNNSTTSGIDIASLTENLRPTRTQRLLPHHPLLDILPWPRVRDNLIIFFAQPVTVRPAGLDMGQLVADLEDDAEGVVVRAGGTGRGKWGVGRWVRHSGASGGLCWMRGVGRR